VLLFGQTFNDFSGGGITLTSLFKDWPKECLASVSYPFMLHQSTTDHCNNYYQIGTEELKWRFPFFLIKQKFPSGRLAIRTEGRITVLKESQTFRNVISSHMLTPFIRWSGLIHCISTIHLSQRLKEWLTDFSPDIIYMQISNRESINFASELIDYLKIPSVIHMMDDWPSTISDRGLFRNFWHRKIENDFKKLLDKTDIHLSISDAMSEEYLERYGKSFTAFHNAIEYERFKTALALPKSRANIFKVLYVGRVGLANKGSLVRFATFISRYEPGDLNVEFDIYTKDIDNHQARKLAEINKVNVIKAVSHNKIPSLLKSYDLLLLPLDFTESGLKFSRLSMPTKASEYMISGTPVLVFAPEGTAVSKFFSTNNCGHCVSSSDNSKLAEAIYLLSHDKRYRDKLITNAMNLAETLFDIRVVSKEFKKLLSQLKDQPSRSYHGGN